MRRLVGQIYLYLCLVLNLILLITSFIHIRHGIFSVVSFRYIVILYIIKIVLQKSREVTLVVLRVEVGVLCLLLVIPEVAFF